MIPRLVDLKAIERFAEHCPVHATINMMENLEIEISSEGQFNSAAE